MHSKVISLNQDPLGVPGDLIWKQGPLEIYAAPLKGGGRGVILFNRHLVGPPTPITVPWELLGYPSDVAVTVRELYGQQDLGEFTQEFTARVYNGDVAVVRLEPKEPSEVYEQWRPWETGPAPAPSLAGSVTTASGGTSAFATVANPTSSSSVAAAAGGIALPGVILPSSISSSSSGMQQQQTSTPSSAAAAAAGNAVPGVMLGEAEQVGKTLPCAGAGVGVTKSWMAGAAVAAEVRERSAVWRASRSYRKDRDRAAKRRFRGQEQQQTRKWVV
jgi:hypothetical protein